MAFFFPHLSTKPSPSFQGLHKSTLRPILESGPFFGTIVSYAICPISVHRRATA